MLKSNVKQSMDDLKRTKNDIDTDNLQSSAHPKFLSQSPVSRRILSRLS